MGFDRRKRCARLCAGIQVDVEPSIAERRNGASLCHRRGGSCEASDEAGGDEVEATFSTAVIVVVLMVILMTIPTVIPTLFLTGPLWRSVIPPTSRERSHQKRGGHWPSNHRGTRLSHKFDLWMIV
jgi:hypothetical protein